ncbi:MAG: autotransporter domain-containing protein [Verrucomicrobia bacterium]|nr:autotransporter domain-containing protein [Verrucomicrobiota bacterium]
MSIRYPYLASLVASSLFLSSVEAIVDSSFAQGGPGTFSWDVAANWTPLMVPNANGDIARFDPKPTVSPVSINTMGAGTTITIGSLYLSATANGMMPDVTFTAPFTALKFQAFTASQSALISVGSTGARYFFDIPITFASNTDIYQNNSTSGAFVFDQAIGGSGNVNYWGPQEMIWEQIIDNSLSGTVTVNAGTFTLAGTSKTIFGPLVVQNAGFLNLTQPNQFGPNVDVTVKNGGQVTGNGNNQSCRSLTIAGGGDVAMSSGTWTLTQTSASPALSFARGNYSGNLSLPNGGFITCDATQGSSLISNAQINLGGNTVQVRVLGKVLSGLSMEATVVTNGTLQKTGDGTLSIGGTPSDNYPAFTVVQGELDIGQATVASVAVNPGAAVKFGNATIPGGAINNGTAIESGGILVGNYTQTASGTLLATLRQDSAAFNVNSGTVNLAGALQAQLADARVVNGEQLVVIDNSLGTGISGTFASFSTNLPSNVHASLIYNPFSVVMVFDVLAIPAHVNVANAVFATQDAHNLQMVRRCQFMRSRLSSPNRVDIASSTSASFSQDELLASAGGFLAQGKEASNEPSKQVSASRFRNNPEGKPLSIYFGPLGSFGHIDNIHSQKGFHYNTAGGLFGADYAFSWAGFGGEIGYERFDAKVKDHAGSFDIDNVFGRLYATITPSSDPRMFLDMAIGMGGEWYNIRRKVSGATPKAQTHGWEWDTYFAFGYDAWFDHVRLTPIIAVQSIDLYVKKYHERDAGNQGVIVNHQHRTSVRSDVGMSLGGKLVREKVTWLPEIRGYWQHEFLDKPKKLGIAAVGFEATSQISVFGASKNYGIIGTEQRFLFSDKWTIALDYDYQWGEHLRSNNFLFELGVYF